MEIIFDIMGSTLVAELFGEMDHHAAEKARDKIDAALDNHGPDGRKDCHSLMF